MRNGRATLKNDSRQLTSDLKTNRLQEIEKWLASQDNHNVNTVGLKLETVFLSGVKGAIKAQCRQL